MSNPYESQANLYAEEASQIQTWTEEERAILAAQANAQATLALAHEQQTANLIAFAQLCVTIDGTGINLHAELAQINARLGLGETK